MMVINRNIQAVRLPQMHQTLLEILKRKTSNKKWLAEPEINLKKYLSWLKSGSW